MSQDNTRIEKDSMGTMEVPMDAYYGASTMRAVKNFPISKLRFGRSFIKSIAIIKAAAAKTNIELGLLDSVMGKAIYTAAKEVSEGLFDDHFVVDVFQTGSGTSTNMNANEVIANRANELLAGQNVEVKIHPNDHVNICQSSNDVIPTAIHLAILLDIKEKFKPALSLLHDSLGEKSCRFWPVIKTGRTHLQDATPIRLGQQFFGFTGQVKRSIERLATVEKELVEVAIGGTAVGTGVNAHPQFASTICRIIGKETGVNIVETENHFQAQNTLDSVVQTSGTLRTIAVSIHKIANDIRWLSSGPRAGIGEINLPEVQPGSSIMPGKVNPVIPESVIQAMAHVIGNDLVICQAGQGGIFELNMMMPVAAYNILESIEILTSSVMNFSKQCIEGIEATAKGPEMVEQGLMLGTALAPAIGYDAAAAIAKEASVKGATIRQIALKRTSLSPEELDQLLNPELMTFPGLGHGPSGG
ncbi:class II fumarate hydratase [SAR202 cluster bacterium AC-409-J13_OGT_754m]|nr:class II fumarate hydratase [SAR202 cluster bacterium AC-409-J13_OGT_754m]